VSARVAGTVFAPYLALIFVVAVGAIVVVAALMNRGDDDVWMASAERTAYRADAFVQQLEREHVTALYAATHDPALPDALRGQDVPAVSRILAAYLSRSETDAVDVVTPDGALASMRSTAGPAEPRLLVGVEPLEAARSWGVTARALAGERDGFGETWAGLVGDPLGAMIYTAAPVRVGEHVVGVVLAGTALQRAIERAARAAGGDVSVYDANGRILATTVGEMCCNGANGTRTLGAPMAADMARGVFVGRATVLRGLPISGAVYREHVRALQIRGEVVAAMGGVIKAPSGVRGTATTLIVACVGVVCAILAFGVIATRRVVRPFTLLVEAQPRWVDWRSAPYHVVSVPVAGMLSGRLN
jgi:hypothetical protein